MQIQTGEFAYAQILPVHVGGFRPRLLDMIFFDDDSPKRVKGA